MIQNILKSLAALLSVTALLYFIVGQGDPVPAFSVEASKNVNDDECATAKRCLYVYVAPW